MRSTSRILVIALLAGFSTLAATNLRASDAATNHTSPASRDLASLVTRPIPPRDLYALADQLKLRPPRPIAHVVRSSSPNYRVGHTDRFYVLAEDTNKYFTMKATIRAETAHLYIYVQNGVQYDPAATKKAAQTFEKSIYPRDRSFFGSEWRPGVDDDPHITCLVGNLRSSQAAGFFSAEDEYPRLVNPYSNQREMIYLNSTSTVPGDSSFLLIMAHEFQHMIHWHMHPRDNAWTNEGMSMLAEYLNHYPPDEEAQSFTQRPTTQLDTWSLDDAATIPHYGGAYLYLLYLYDHFGRGLIHQIVSDKQFTDLELINDALLRSHIHQTARQIFTKWVVANWLNDPAVAHRLYAYKNVTYRVSDHLTRTVPFNAHSSVPPWAAQYTVMDSLQNVKPFRLQFSAPATVPLVSFKNVAPGWWSNRGDMIDTRLQRTVDLRHVHHATLHFQSAYDIEKDYDYAYVEVSRDGGKTWTTIRGTHTTKYNPNGANYGNGYTGARGWSNETVDLSRYAGQQVKLRFQYITDDEYNGQSMVIKNISIPEIGYHDTMSGWTAQGFVPVTSNSLPSQWTVQLISYTSHGTTVSTLPLSRAQGSITVDPSKNGLKKLVVVVFTTAPKSTVASTYALSASALGG